MKITIHTIAYNEAFFLPYFFAHYLKRFPVAHIVVYDNESTDNTIDIAMAFGAEIRTYNTGGKLSDQAYLDIKNNCWKDAKTDWVLICDVDELFDFGDQDLDWVANSRKDNIVRSKGFNMVNMNDDMNVAAINHGVRAPSYDKVYLFNKSVKEINYRPGAHKCEPEIVIENDGLFGVENYPCYHYKYVNIDYMIARHSHYASRMSEENIRKGYGGHYLYPADQIREEFETARKNAIKIL